MPIPLVAMIAAACSAEKPIPLEPRKVDAGDCSQIEYDYDGDGAVILRDSCSLSGRVDDCNDYNASVFQLGYPDADRDGWTLDAECVGALPPGYRATEGPPDCDDADPTRQQRAYTDADGDGRGVESEELCVAAVPDPRMPPAGISLRAGDCNDTDPAMFTGATETWDDGVDSNCDGHDDPMVCDAEPAPCGCELLDLPRPEIDQGCTSADLFLAGVKDCGQCKPHYVVVGNRGTVPAEGLQLQPQANTPLAIPGTLGPGEIARPVVLFPAANGVTVTVQSNTAECNTENNEVALVFAECEVP